MRGTKDSSFYNTNINEWDWTSSCDLVILFFSALMAAMATLCSITTYLLVNTISMSGTNDSSSYNINIHEWV